MERLENFKAGFIRENPIFGLYLGCCSALAISTTLNNAIGMGVAVILVTIMSNVIISAIRKITPDEIRIPVYIVVIATLVKIIQMLVQAYATDLYTALGIFLPLIVVNCIILGRAEAFASKNGLLDSALDGLGMGLGYTFGLLAMSTIRQLLATGMLSFANPFNPTQIFFQAEFFPAEYTISLFKDPIGAFITFACLAAALNAYKASKNKKNWGIGLGVVVLALVAVIAVRGEFNVIRLWKLKHRLNQIILNRLTAVKQLLASCQKAVKTAKRPISYLHLALLLQPAVLKILSRSLLMKLQAQLRALKLILSQILRVSAMQSTM